MPWLDGQCNSALHLYSHRPRLPHIARQEVDLGHVPGERDGVRAPPVELRRDEVFSGSGHLLRVRLSYRHSPHLRKIDTVPTNHANRGQMNHVR
jgi:hypothetical protein